MVHESDARLMKILILISLLEEIERRYRTKFHYRNDRTTQTRAIISDLQIYDFQESWKKLPKKESIA